MDARVTEVIRTSTPEGKGTEADPLRRVVRYWSLDGDLLATNDPYTQEQDEDAAKPIQQAPPS